MAAEPSAAGRFRMGWDVTKLTIADVLARQAELYPDKVFLRSVHDTRELTFMDTASLSSRLAGGLARAGVSRGSHIAIMLENSVEQVLCHFAVGILGAVVVPINLAARGAILQHLLVNSHSTFLIASTESLKAFAEIATNVPGVTVVVTLCNPAQASVPQLDADIQIHDYADLIAADPVPLTGSCRFDDLAYIMYTSGTTGPSKGVMLTQARNLLWGIGHAESYGHRHDDIFYVCLPLFHVNALQGTLYLALTLGAQVVIRRRFSASAFWSDIKANGATISNLLGSMVNILWARLPGPDDASTIRMSLCAPIPTYGPDFEKRFGLRFIAAYSLTDFGASHALTLAAPSSKLRSCGQLRPGFRAQIVDEHDFALPADQPGSLVVACDLPWNVSSGYYGLPEVTLKSWRNGWFHTGDLARIDTDGYLWFVDRQKDVVRRRGENISAHEVEQVLLAHPAIADIAIFPLASDMSEEEVACALVAKQGSRLSVEDVADYAEQHLPKFMVPRFIAIMADLPRNESHKIEKRKLRAEAEADIGLFWDREAARGR